MRRRILLGGALAVSSGALLNLDTATPASAAVTAGTPPTVTPDDLVFPRRPHRLRRGTPGDVDLIAEHVARIRRACDEYMRPGDDRDHPSYPGYAVLAARDGVVVEHAAGGHALRYESWDEEAQEPVELPEDEWQTTSVDTIFDMASVSKLFTSVAVIQLAEEGLIDLSAPVTRYVPEFASLDPAKADIVVEQLLTHTAGQKAFINLYSLPDNEARMQAIFAEPLVFEPGNDYVYSDLNLIIAATAIENVTGSSLDRVVAERITEPLGMSDTMYNPPPSLWDRVAATEYQPWTDRGMIRGSVHDENAWSFGGVAGHAGVFGTARDLAVFGQMVLNGGVYEGERILSEESVRSMLTNRNTAFGAGAARGLGWQLDQRFFMDALTSPVSTGHTGYTGTSIVLDPLSGTQFILLTNRVHPTRERGAVSDYRRAAIRHLARSLPVRARHRRGAWFGGQTDATETSLTVPLDLNAAGRTTFRLWYDTEPSDTCVLEAEVDGTWTPIPMSLAVKNHRWNNDGEFSGFSGRQWIECTGVLPVGVGGLRWRYTTDPTQQGRGVYLDEIRVFEGPRLVFTSTRPRDEATIVTDGWEKSPD
ncbi:MAG TPA: serine hydrolase [Candidatus Stackebrandtia excrementipullorum]|nr:serine hydrolase [Candidatus Stackebrandtia excrementipullorum]